MLRDETGKLLATLERADIAKLTAAGWKPPTPFTVKARDGVTDLYGLLFKPTSFDAAKKHPIVNHIYPGPQTGSVGSRSFSAARADCQALDGLALLWLPELFDRRDQLQFVVKRYLVQKRRTSTNAQRRGEDTPCSSLRNLDELAFLGHRDCTPSTD